MMRMEKIVTLTIFLQFFCCVTANFQEGEIVPTSRRGQYHGSRTVWHDLMGRHCPRFGKDSKVAIPIPKPVDLNYNELVYKLQFSFSDRLYSPWLQIIGKGTVGPPIVLMQLEHIGDTLKSIRAEVVPLKPEYVREHQQILREFQNSTIWPKHLLVHYTWRHTNPINVHAGLYLVFFLGISVSIVLAVSVMVSYQDRLQSFLSDMTADQDSERRYMQGPGNSWAKAE